METHLKKSYFLFLISFILSLLACKLFSPSPAPTPTQTDIPSDCSQATEPTQEDIEISLNFGEDIFHSPEWKRSYTVESHRVSVTWINNDEGAVAYLDYLIFSCGYTQPELEEYFSDGYWDIIFQNYQGYEPTNICGGFEQDLKLYEFATVSNGEAYISRYWAWPNTTDRVLTMFLVFPTTSEASMDSYSEKMFPAIVSCSK